MNYSRENLEKSQVKFLVEANAEEWANAINEAYNKTKGKFNIEGFRKGKAPKKVIESQYGVSIFFEDALDIIIPKLYEEILDKETEINPVARPDVDVVAISDTEVKLSYIVALYPEVKVGAYTGLEIKEVEYPVSDDMVNEQLKQAQDRVATWENVERVAKLGDTVVLDFSGSIDGVKFEGGTAEKHSLELGSNTFIPGFEVQIVGLSINEEKDVIVSFPADYGVEELNGKEAVFAIKVHEIKEKNTPELNDEFAKDVSEFDTFDAYREDIFSKLATQNQTKADRENEDNIITAIVATTEVEIPDAMIENQIDEMISEFEYRLMHQGMKMDDYYKYTNTNRGVLASQYRERSEKNVKIRLIMSEIVKAEGFTASAEEIDTKISMFAQGENKEVEEFKKTMQPQQLDYMANEIVTDKLFDFLKANNKFIKA